MVTSLCNLEMNLIQLLQIMVNYGNHIIKHDAINHTNTATHSPVTTD